MENWKSQFVTTNYMTTAEIQSIKMGVRRPPFAFTEQGVSQLSSVLNSEIAIEKSIRIIDAFVLMPRYLTANAEEKIVSLHPKFQSPNIT